MFVLGGKRPRRKSGPRSAILMRALAILISGLLMVGSACAEEPTYEATGSATAEEAAQRYLEALSDMNLDAMLATFAIETYVDHFDFQGQLRRMKSYSINFPFRAPNTNGLTRQLNVESRKASITNAAFFQLISLWMPQLDVTTLTTFTSDEQADEFLDSMEQAMQAEALESLKIDGTRPPSLLSDMYENPKNQENIARGAKICGADEVVSVAIEFHMGEHRYLMLADAARYGEKWYMLSLGGNIGALLNVANYRGGLMPLD